MRSVTSIIVLGREGNDRIKVQNDATTRAGLLGKTVDLRGGAGTDLLTIAGRTTEDRVVYGYQLPNFTGGSGNDGPNAKENTDLLDDPGFLLIV
jgi:hypothetical protein